MSYLFSRAVLHGRHTISASSNSKLLCILGFYPSMSSPRLFSSASSENSFTISYLIDACRLSPKSASSIAKQVRFNSPEKPDAVISFFNKLGLSQSQIRTAIRIKPELLLADAEKTLIPKIDFFRSKGVSDSGLAKILSSSPSILLSSRNNQLTSHFNFLSNLLQSDSKALEVLERFPYFISTRFEDDLLSNINILREIGVSESTIGKVFCRYPKVFWKEPEAFKEIVEQVRGMGLNPSALNFVLAVCVLRKLSKSTWEKKVDIYKRFGLSEKEIVKAFKRHPWCMLTSEAKIMAVMEFLVSKMGFEPSDVAKRSAVIAMSVEKRIIPRGIFALDLLSKGLVKNFTLSALLYTSEEAFLKKFVNCHEEKDSLLQTYREKLALPRVDLLVESKEGNSELRKPEKKKG